MSAAEEDNQPVATGGAGGAGGAGVAVTLLTMVHYICTECRSVVLLWWSALSVIVSEATHTHSRDFVHMNKPMKDCISKWASSIIWRPGAVDCEANARIFEYHPDHQTDCAEDRRVWMGMVNGGGNLPRMAGGYQVEGEDPITEVLAGGICQSALDMQHLTYGNGLGEGCTLTGGCSTRDQWVQLYTRFQDVDVDEHGNSSVPHILWYFALCIHLWLLLVLGSRVVLWLRCREARDFRSGGYVKFCVQLEKSRANIWTVRCSIALFFGLIIAGLVKSLQGPHSSMRARVCVCVAPSLSACLCLSLSLCLFFVDCRCSDTQNSPCVWTGDGRLTGQLSNFLIILFALWRMYSTPYATPDGCCTTLSLPLCLCCSHTISAVTSARVSALRSSDKS